MKKYIISAISPLSDQPDDIRKELARDKEADSSVIDELSSDRARKVREQVARNSSISTDNLTQLANDKSYKVRLQVAKNPNTPVNLLSQMVKSEFERIKKQKEPIYNVLWELLKNENTPLEDRLSIANDYNVMYYAPGVREFLARKKSTPSEILDCLTNGYYKIPEGLSVLLAKNPNSPSSILRSLYKRGYTDELAKNPSTPPDILHKIFNEDLRWENFSKCKEVLKNPNLSKRLKVQMETELAEKSGAYKQKFSLHQFIGKDIWLSATYCGISSDYDTYIRLISSAGKGKYHANVITPYFFDGTHDRFMQEAQEDEIYPVAIYDAENSEDAEILIDRNYKTFTTEELMAELCRDYGD